MTEQALLRAMRIVAMTNAKRMKLFTARELDPEAVWFLEHIDELAPELHSNGWVEYGEFKHEPGCVTVTNSIGRLQTIVATDAGRKMLNAAVAQ